ncbi:MAG: hypothetical protein AMJ92_02510 [candidate division Zixibacteria bacterium SM23_81]|nr:MAG: hypothetical protein AMJ92_02510 [candidate division Zixibacteria bacterium SM23_81]
MFKRTIVAFTLICFVAYLQGCYSPRQISREQLEQHPDCSIAKVVTVDGEIFEFTTSPGLRAHIRENMIEGRLKDGTLTRIPLSQVKMVYIKRFDAVRSCILGISVLVLLFVGGLSYALTEKGLCPFVYSYNADEFIFDGEPYGGAICEGLQRTDLCRLEHLNAVDGEYRLLLTNEVNQTQYTDEFKLLVVDHPQEVDVIQDADGNIYTVAALQKPLLAVDHRNEDLQQWLSEKDLLFWESDVLSKDPANPADLRDTLFLTFPKPANADKAKLVVHGCTTLWGSQMLRRMTEIRGDQLENWYAGLNNAAQKEMLNAWNKREQIYKLQVYIWAANTWAHRGEIMGGGPFIAEERVVPLDLADIEGDTLKIRVSPPTGFWQLNSFAVDYSQDVPFEFHDISASSATGHDGVDLRSVLESTDANYYVMPEVGQRAYLTFPVPPPKLNSERTVFAKVSGYYDMHLNASGKPKSEIVHRILSEPGYVTKFALQEYFKWRSDQLEKAEK